MSVSLSCVLLSALVLGARPSPAPDASIPPAVVAGPEAPESWAVVHGGNLWVCWRAGPDCWRRVELEAGEGSGNGGDLELGPGEFLGSSAKADAPALGQVRLAFSSPQRLWIVGDEGRWVLDRGQARARLVEARPPVATRRPSPPRCGPEGVVPSVWAGSLGWRSAPRCGSPPTGGRCLAASARGLRRPTGLRVRGGVELLRWQGRGMRGPSSSALARRRSAGLELLFVVELAFDPGRKRAESWARRRAAQGEAARLRRLPAVEPGPLAEAEREAYAALSCGGRAR